MGFDINKIEVSADMLNQSAGNFKASMKKKFGKAHTNEEYNKIVEKFYGKDKVLVDEQDNKPNPKPRKSK